VSEFYKGSAESNCFLAVDKEAIYFCFCLCFCCGGNDMVQFVADDMYGSFQRWWFCGGLGGIEQCGANIVVAANTTVGLRHGGVGGVTVNVEDHSAGVVPDGGIGMSCIIVEKLHDDIGRIIGSFGLFSCKGVEGDKESDVNSSGIVK
jgi:hypothetical protein